ncbi:unannotated protein [freshwater metagenome]|uniref:Unannotated protein n=1 Tax=freshwater metagenome TaxID=449393 RepID=A0A6J7TWG3_9ZZZZ
MGVGVEVGVALGVGVGVALGVGAATGVRVGTGLGRATPLFHTNFFPLLMQVNFVLPDTETCPTLVQVAPGLTTAAAVVTPVIKAMESGRAISTRRIV